MTTQPEGGFVLKQLDPPVAPVEFYEREEVYDEDGELGAEASEEKEEEEPVEPLPLVALTEASLTGRDWRLIKL